MYGPATTKAPRSATIANSSCQVGYLCCGDASGKRRKVFFDPFGFFQCCPDGKVAPRNHCSWSNAATGSKELRKKQQQRLNWPKGEAATNQGNEQVKIIPQIPEGRTGAPKKQQPTRPIVKAKNALAPKLRDRLVAFMKPAPLDAMHKATTTTTRRPTRLLSERLPMMIRQNDRHRHHQHHRDQSVVMASGEQLINCNNNFFSIPVADRPFFSCCGDSLYFWLTERCVDGRTVVSRADSLTSDDDDDDDDEEYAPAGGGNENVENGGTPTTGFELGGGGGAGGSPVIARHARQPYRSKGSSSSSSSSGNLSSKRLIEQLLQRILPFVPMSTTKSPAVERKSTTTDITTATRTSRLTKQTDRGDDGQQVVETVSMVCNGAHYIIPASQRDQLGCCGSHLYFPNSQKCKVWLG